VGVAFGTVGVAVAPSSRSERERAIRQTPEPVTRRGRAGRRPSDPRQRPQRCPGSRSRSPSSRVDYTTAGRSTGTTTAACTAPSGCSPQPSTSRPTTVLTTVSRNPHNSGTEPVTVHGARRVAAQMRATPQQGGQPRMRAPRRTPGPSLARPDPEVNKQVAAGRAGHGAVAPRPPDQKVAEHLANS